MKTITEHHVNECNRKIRITADDPDPKDGASHLYVITVDGAAAAEAALMFQHGPIKDGINGITNEALLAVLMDRLRGFQAGTFATNLNAVALEHLERAMKALNERTRQREERGVEGTHEP